MIDVALRAYAAALGVGDTGVLSPLGDSRQLIPPSFIAPTQRRFIACRTLDNLLQRSCLRLSEYIQRRNPLWRRISTDTRRRTS